MAMKIVSLLKNKNDDATANRPVTIGFIGDSVTNGCFEVLPSIKEDGTEGMDVVYDTENAYPAKLRKILTTLYPMAQINIVNAGISGDDAPGGLMRVDRDLLAFKPDLTVVCFGLNDSCYGEDKLEKYRKALTEIIEKIKASGSEVILMTPQPICARVHTQLRGDTLRKFGAQLTEGFKSGLFAKYMDTAREVAAECGVTVCDCYAKWMKLYEGGVDITDLLCNYLNHPTRDMHWLFATSLADTIFEM